MEINYLDELMQRFLKLTVCMEDIKKADKLLLDTYVGGGKVLVCGNGGSAADSDHIVGELMKGFLLKRKMNEQTAQSFRDALGDDAEDFVVKLQYGVPAISLPAQSAVLSAYANDVDAELVYAQLVFGYGKSGDLLICLSTSGNSKNAVAAAKVAKALGVKTLALTGAKESKLSEICDVCIKAPETETFKVQELHLPIYHYLCANLEDRLFNK